MACCNGGQLVRDQAHAATGEPLLRTTSRMYFLRGEATARSETGLVQQTVQIVASHDLTLVVARSNLSR